MPSTSGTLISSRPRSSRRLHCGVGGAIQARRRLEIGQRLATKAAGRFESDQTDFVAVSLTMTAWRLNRSDELAEAIEKLPVELAVASSPE